MKLGSHPKLHPSYFSVRWRFVAMLWLLVSSSIVFALSPVETALREGQPVTLNIVEKHYALAEVDEATFWTNMDTLSPAIREFAAADAVILLLENLPTHWSIGKASGVHMRHSYDLMALTRFQTALELLEPRVDSYLNWQPTTEADITHKANLLHIYGQLLVRKNQISAALGYFYEAEAMFRDLDENHPSIFTIKVILGEAFLAARRYEEAIEYLHQAQEIFPEKRLDGRSYVAALEIKAHQRAGNLDEALDAAESYLANPIDPREDYYLFFLLAYLEVLREAEEYKKYQAYIETTYALAEKIGNEDYLLEVTAHKGNWYLINTRYSEAIELLETVTQGETDIRNRVHLDAYLWLVEAYRSLSMFSEALATQTDYIELLSLEFEEINQKAIEEVSASFRLVAAKADSKNAELERGLEEEKRIRAQLTTWVLILVVVILAALLAFSIFILLVLKKKAQALDEIAWVDPLTKVGNRLLMGQDAEKALPCFVALIDIDYLKYYNDQFGHARGDELLVFFANQLIQQTQALPFSANVYRIGGDEFVVTSEQGDRAEFESCLKRIDQALKDEGFTKAGLSYGIADGGEYSDFSEALSKADARMYEMKSNRKNSR